MERSARQMSIALAVLVLVGGVFLVLRAQLLRSLAEVETAWAELRCMTPERYRLIRELAQAVDAATDLSDDAPSGASSNGTDIANQHLVDSAQAAGELRSVTVQRIDCIWDAFEAAAATDHQAKALMRFDQELSALLAMIRDSAHLRQDTKVVGLATEVVALEDSLAVKQMRLGLEVRRHNFRLCGFPTALVARLIGFNPLTRFEGLVEAGVGGPVPEADTGP